MTPISHGTHILRRRYFRRHRVLRSAVAGCCAAAAVVAAASAPTAYAADPSNDEQYMLELLNRMRINPSAELHKLVNISGNPAVFGNPISSDPNVAFNVQYWGVVANTLQQQWNTLTPVAPVAWNTSLNAAAAGHDQLMIQYNTQSHQLPGESDPGTRITNAGYPVWSAWGENVAAYSQNVFFGHASLAIDWGPGPAQGGTAVDGIQNPPGHRLNMMSTNYREVGISITPSLPTNTIGPLVITQDFASRLNDQRSFLLGVVYNDTTTADNFYTPGEGLGGVGVQIYNAGTLSVVASTTTSGSGGYQLQLPPGSYDVQFSGGGLASLMTYRNVTIGAGNVKVDSLTSWMPDAGGSWTNSANWSAGAPVGQGTLAVLGPATTANRTITIDSAVSTGTIKFDSPVGYTIAATGTNALTMDVLSGAAAINVAQPASHTISANLAMLASTNFNIAPGGALTLAGSFNLLFGNTATVNGAGTLNLTGSQTFSSSSTFTANGGSINVGGPGGLAAPLNLPGTLAINNAATFKLLPTASAATRVTGNFVNQLSISGQGLLDVGNHFLQVDNTATPESAVRAYLHNGYNADASGIGNWNGRGGITSSDAIKSHNGPSANFKISIGYVNGAYANDPLIGGSIPGLTLATNRTPIRPALYGDLNLDGKVDDTDLAIFSGLGQYNKPTPKFGWLGGDLNHDGHVDDTDLLIFSGAGNYNGPSYGSDSTPTLTTSAATAGTTLGSPGDGILDFAYDPTTGDVKVKYDGDSRITAANPLQVIRFKSAGGHFLPAAFNGSGFSNTTTDNSTLNGTILGAGSLPDGYDLGQILATGLQTSDLISDLTLQWNVSGGGLSLKNGDVTLVPEPTTAAVLSLVATVTLTARRRRRRATNAS
jgi:hypothetical protein